MFRYFSITFITIYLLWSILKPIFFNYFCIIFGLSIISWTIAYYFYELFNEELIDNIKNKIILITGCDTGFGNLFAQRLDQLGFHVYAGVLNPDGDNVRLLQEKCSNRLKILKMDVTNRNDVENVIEKIENTKLPLWAVINNAGIAIPVPFDWGDDIDCYRKVFDVNVFGVIRVTKLCLPLLKQSNGRIINIASLASRITVPLLSHYSMSKHCVRVFSDSMRREINLTSDIKVITLEPSFFRTEIVNPKKMDQLQKDYLDETPENLRKFYNDDKIINSLKQFNRIIKYITKDNYEIVIESMLRGVINKNPKLYYRCCTYYEIILFWATSHLPELIIDYFIINGFKFIKLFMKK